jgi:L-lactate dehydrogenase
MGGPRIGIVGAGGVGVAASSAIIMRGLAGRVTIYSRTADTARGLALDFLHAQPLLPHIEIRGLGSDNVEEEDILVITAGHHTKPGENRLEMLRGNLEVMDEVATAVEAGQMPRIALVVTNPLDVMTEYLTRRWADRPVAVMGSGTALDTLRLTQRVATDCQVHPRSVHAWVVGEHGDSSVFLLSSATVGTMPLLEFAAQRGVDLGPRHIEAIEHDVRQAAYQVRDLKGAAVQGIGLTVSGLIHAACFETGAIIPVSVRVGDDICASLPCVIGPDGPSAPLQPVMCEEEHEGWLASLDIIRAANETLPTF